MSTSDRDGASTRGFQEPCIQPIPKWDSLPCAAYHLPLVVRHMLQNGGEGNMRQGSEELMHREATAREFGRSQAAEEAGEGTRVNKRIRLLAAQERGLVPDGVVNGNRRAGW